MGYRRSCDMGEDTAVGKYRIEMENYSGVMLLCDYHLTVEAEFAYDNPSVTLSTLEVFPYEIQPGHSGRCSTTSV